MKNLIKFSAIALLFVFVIFSCKEDDPEPEVEYNLNTEYFTVSDAAYVQDMFPEASSGTVPVIDVINGNTSVIPGGSNPIAIQSNDDISKILIGVSGVGGYYSLPATGKTTGLYQFIILMNQTLAVDTFNIIIAIQTADGIVSEYSIITVSLVQVGTGKLQVSLSWDQANDVDLHLIEPNGFEIYYGDATSSNGGILDLDSNAACSIDNVNNENITYSDTSVVEAGEYIVNIDLWSNCAIPDNTSYYVTAYYEGALLSTSFGENPYSGTFDPQDYEEVTAMKFNIPTSKSSDEVYKMTFPSNKRVINNLSPQKTK